MIDVKLKKGIIDVYYKHIEDKYCYKTCDELLGKKYFISKQFGVGNFSRMKIEDGLEISTTNIDYKMDMDFYNIGFDDDILELGYCYNGNMKVFSSPDDKMYLIKAGDIFIYKTLNDVNNFKFQYSKFKAMSIHMNFNIIKNAINPIWENKIIMDWEVQLKDIFKEDVLIIEKATYDIKQVAEQIQNISTDDMIGYIKLKLKTIEFLATFLEERATIKFLENTTEYEEKIVIKAKNIIAKDLQNPPSVKKLADNLNISLYKLQQAFKNITGNTVYEYIKKARIEKAKYLLRNTDMSIIEIANEIGYENPSKFASLFRSYNNITPLKYRKLQ
ncbi:helix-turn-helix transcriptional regulator [Clostridium botulinum D/C]|nr:helix-turn-helix transcriptional regulator [Clostridium botulinum D/C]MCD3359591.1 helix-turn-helix transcriptional regulator [Clostridium botulinum D/C]MCD3362074.1 helix-turn-helix transcriptional regulator [Clostridium botulinum D/C]MCD3365288.1 helix-turn-helix transcriptional regulator [Clostridium botulinum D/C]